MSARTLPGPAPAISDITGTEVPLTPADINALVHVFYNADRAALVLRGGGGCDLAYMRPSFAGGSRDIDGALLLYQTDRRGIWALLHTTPRRAGHIPWRDAEAVIHAAATPDTAAALLAAVDAYQAHRRAYVIECEPYRFQSTKPAYDMRTDIALSAAADCAWARLLDGEAVQLDLLQDPA